MPGFQTPGVYYERVDAAPPGIAALRTDIAGFVGIARRGPLHTPVPVQSLRQFQGYFGDFTGAGYLAYAVRAFFENGGRRCWVVRVASEAATAAETVLLDAARQPVWRVTAFSPGVWGNDLEVRIQETHRAQTRTDPRDCRPEATAVASVNGFERATHVRLVQGATVRHKVVAGVDAGEQNLAGEKRLIWVHDRPEERLPFETPLAGFDLSRPILVESLEDTLLVWELGRLSRVYEGLSLFRGHPRYGPGLLAGLEVAPDAGAPRKLPDAPEPVVIEELRDAALPAAALLEPLRFVADPVAPRAMTPELRIPLSGGADGLALLSVADYVGEEVSALESDEAARRKRRGLRALESVGEVAILAVPDIHIQPLLPPAKAPPPPCIPDPCLPLPPAVAPGREPAIGDLPPVFGEQEIFQVQAAMVEQCERLRDRIALLEPPFGAARDDALGVGAVMAWRRRFETKYAALYYPWLRVVDPLRLPGALTRDIPPGGHVAGQYALTDFQVGVHKAPANAALAWVQDVTVAVNEAAHGLLNDAGINAIRPLPGRGLRIFGARLVSSDPDWRFVNVRRLMMMIEKAIDAAIQWAVFEPNDWRTRLKLQLALRSFLLALWQNGALMGATADAAFFVKCDDENNPPAARDQGQLLAQVGVAPSQPFEFIVVRVGRAQNAFEITEAA